MIDRLINNPQWTGLDKLIDNYVAELDMPWYNHPDHTPETKFKVALDSSGELNCYNTIFSFLGYDHFNNLGSSRLILLNKEDFKNLCEENIPKFQK